MAFTYARQSGNPANGPNSGSKVFPEWLEMFTPTTVVEQLLCKSLQAATQHAETRRFFTERFLNIAVTMMIEGRMQ